MPRFFSSRPAPVAATGAPGEASAVMYTRSNNRVIFYCVIASLLAILFGLETGEVSGFIAMPRFNQDFGKWDEKSQSYVVDASQQTALNGLNLAGALVAAIISGIIGNRVGRRVGLFLSAICALIGPGTLAGTTTFSGFLAGRFISGMGIGFSANFVISYWAEITPASLRGIITILNQGIINVGTLIGQSINEGTHNLESRWAYRGPVLTELLPPLILLPFLYWMPETPRFFIAKNRPSDALKAMHKIRGPTHPSSEIEDEVDEIITFYEIEKELEGSSTWADCFRGTDLRRTGLTVMTIFGQDLSGIVFVTAYGTLFYQLSGIQDPFLVTVITGVCGIAGSITSGFLVKLLGRRPILIVGAAVQSLSMLLLAIIGTVAPGSPAAAKSLTAFVSLFIFTYGATWGSVTQVLLGEIPSTRLRTKTIAMATGVGFSLDLLIICGMPYLISPDYDNLGAKVGFIFGGCQAVVFLWAVLCIPETKDRTLEEIDEMFLNKIPARKFKSYQITREVQGVAARTHDKLTEKHGAVTTMGEA